MSGKLLSEPSESLSYSILIVFLNVLLILSANIAAEAAPTYKGRLFSLSKQEQELYRDYKEKNYSDLMAHLKSARLGRASKLFFEGQIDAALLRDELAKSKLSEFLSFGATNGLLRKDALKALAYVCIRQGDYSGATCAFNSELLECKDIVEGDELNEIQEYSSIVNGLQSVSPQTCDIADEGIDIAFTKDKSGTNYGGLMYVDVKTNDYTEQSMIDTWATFSAASESYARLHRLTIVAKNLSSISVFGKKITMDLAVAKDLQIGKVQFHNVVFCIFKDAFFSSDHSLGFQSIIGMPVLRMLKSINVDADKSLVTAGALPSTNPEQSASKNFFMDGLTPIVDVTVENKCVPFVLDSGADRTMLFSRFKLLFPFLSNTAIRKIVPRNVIGDSEQLEVDAIPELRITLNTQSVMLRDISIFAKNQSSFSVGVGLLGQDVLKNGFKLDFDNMTMAIFAE